MPKSELEVEIEKQSKQRPSLHVNVKKPADYDNTLSENTITSDVNTHIILGGKTQNNPDIAKAAYNSNITLVSGMGTAIKNNPPKLNDVGKLTLSPQFYYDSAVIQISEQTNVDANFGARIRDEKAENSSAIALKADEIRMFSRGTIRIITGIDQRDTPLPPNKDTPPPSHQKRDYSGIHLVAQNVDEGQLQPIVLGRNLEQFLKEILNEIDKIYGLIEQVCENQSKINNAIKEHTHLSNFIPEALLPLTDGKMVHILTEYDNKIKQLVNINNSTTRIPNVDNLRKTYLSSNENTYINSNYNKTN